MPVRSVFASFTSREIRSKFVHAHFAKYLHESVLDVGCFNAPLRNLLGSAKYVGVDIAGNPDITLDMERIDRLPFDDNAFETVLCIDVLEHLDNFHRLFGELVRVSNRHIVVSLPNCWFHARQPISRGKGHFTHYGLPLQRPLDRHKWFFSLSEAREFVVGKSEELGLTIKDMFATEQSRAGFIRLMRKIRYPGDLYQNRYCCTLWSVLEKAPAPTGGQRVYR